MDVENPRNAGRLASLHASLGLDDPQAQRTLRTVIDREVRLLWMASRTCACGFPFSDILSTECTAGEPGNAVSPLIGQLRDYGPADLRGDLAAGLTVAAMLVPQGIACGMPAGLPPLTGLYASMLPMVSYALTGTSRQISVGPDALGSTLVAIGVGALAQKQGRQIDAAVRRYSRTRARVRPLSAAVS